MSAPPPSVVPTRRLRAGLALACILLAPLALAPDSRSAPGDPDQSLPVAGGVYRSVRAPGCSLKGARTVAANRRVRIFTAQGFAFGCLRSADRAYRLGIVGDCQNNNVIDDAVLAGELAALNVHTCGLATAESRPALVNMRDGHVVFASAPLSTVAAEYRNDVIYGMVLTPGGRLAWIGATRGAPDRPPVAVEVLVRVHGSDRASVVVDHGRRIARRSLRREGSRVSWLNAGTRRSATL